jgi:hypothetical protein
MVRVATGSAVRNAKGGTKSSPLGLGAKASESTHYMVKASRGPVRAHRERKEMLRAKTILGTLSPVRVDLHGRSGVTLPTKQVT